MSGGSKKQTIGYKYHIGMQMVLCHGPADSIRRIDVSERTVWTGSATTQLTISAAQIFGGESREGGISGVVDVAMGYPTQLKNDYLVSKLGPDIPAFRGVLAVILRQVYIGLNPYLKPWAFWVRRVLVKTDGTSQWLPDKAAVGTHDLNAAHIIRECLTDKFWGLGYADSLIDDVSFTNSANTLFNEGFGLSILWSKSSSLEDFIGEILSHIDANLYVNRSTGKFTLKLVRNDYNYDLLPEFDDLNVRKVSNFKRTSKSELVNTVNVKFLDVDTGKESSVTVQDAALVRWMRISNVSSNSYFGISNAPLAIKVASRDLKAASIPLASCTMYTNRDGAELNIGDAIKLTWEECGLDEVVMRVANVELGELTDNTVAVNLIEDAFSYSDASYINSNVSLWTRPQNEPSPAPYHRVDEATYYELATTLGDSAAAAIDSMSSYVFLSAVRPSNDSINMQLSSWINSAWSDRGRVDFCPTATTVSAVSKVETVILIDNAIDVDIVSIKTYAYLGSEIVRIDSISYPSVTIARGCLDTVPQTHAAGTRLYFIDEFGGTDEVEYVQGQNAQFKLRPITALGVLPIDSAATQALQIQARHFKPYAPGNFRINSVQYPQVIVSPITFSWAHRDRLLQTTSDIISTTDGNIGPEAGVTYTLTIQRGSIGWTTIKSDNISGTSYSWTTESVDVLDGFSSSQRFLLKSVRGGVDSFQQHEHVADRTGIGYNLGEFLGGL